MKTKTVNYLRKILLTALFFVGYFSSLSLFAQSNAANAGKEFHISYLHQEFVLSTLQLKVVVEKACTITAKYNNQSSIYWNGWNNTLVSPGIYTANVSYSDVVNVPTFGTGEITSRTLSLTSTEDICVYAINYFTATSDATCVLPVSTWGTEYRLATARPHDHARSAYAVVANESGTIVTLHDNSSIILSKNEVYHFLSTTEVDMTGMRITATKPIALFSGTTAAYGPGFYYGCSGMEGTPDHTYEQLWSVDKWGKDFFAFPILTPGTYFNYGGMLALVANQNSTNITVSGGINGGTPLNYTLNAGGKKYICFVMSGLTRIVSNKPIMAFLILPDATVTSILSTDQRVQHALIAPFILSGETNINQHGIDMLVPSAYWNQAVIKHNGVVVPNSLYTVNTSVHFPDWYHVRRNLVNADIAIEITCQGGFLAYLSGNGQAESYGFSAGGGAYNLQNYFTIQENGTTIDTYYKNTTEITHTFESPDIIVVKRTLETPFNYVKWLINGTEYAIAENSNMMNTLNFPASALHSGENTITMSVRFSGTTADSLYTAKVWLLTTNYDAAFYMNEVHFLTDTTFCTKNVNFRAEIEGLHPTAPDSIMWYINDVFETSQATWSKPFENNTYEIKLVVHYDNDTYATLIGTLKVQALWIKMRNVRY